MIFLLIIILLTVFIALKLLNDTRGVCYFGPSMTTDNEKIVRSADQISLLDWPSRMHSIPKNRSQLREYWTILLHILGKFKKNRLSDHMNITLALLSNSISSVLMYFVFSNYFGPTVGFVAVLLYITSFWPYHVALYMGHVHLAQMFFLLAVVCLQVAESSLTPITYLMFFLGGLFTMVSFFSSSASRKYPPIATIALTYSLREHIILPWSSDYASDNLLWIVGIIFLAIAVNLAISIYLKNVVSLLKKITGKDGWKITHVIILKKIITQILVIIGLIELFFNVNDTLILALGSFMTGLAVVSLHILLPPNKFVINLSRYYNWLHVSEWASHFNSYPDKQKTFGRDIPDDFRGGGMIWIHRFFLRVMPFFYPLYLTSMLYLIFQAIVMVVESSSVRPIFTIVFLIMISLMPIIIHEVTKGLKVGKAFMSSLPNMLLIPTMALDQLLFSQEQNLAFINVLWIVFGMIIVAQFVHTVYVLFSDTIPCKMAPTILRNKLKELDIDEFYTYDNPYNDSFVHAMESTYPDEFKVHTINSISEVNSGVLVIPNTSSKAVNMETQQYAILNGDFRKDEELNRLMDNRHIENIALMKIRTMGCSKYYVHESEVTSYRDLILKQVTNQDRWRGNGWIYRV